MGKTLGEKGEEENFTFPERDGRTKSNLSPRRKGKRKGPCLGRKDSEVRTTHKRGKRPRTQTKKMELLPRLKLSGK